MSTFKFTTVLLLALLTTITFQRQGRANLLSSEVKLSDFGAIPNDGKDDRVALMSAKNAAKSGGGRGKIIVDRVGTYDFNGTVDFSDGNIDVVALPGTYTTKMTPTFYPVSPQAEELVINDATWCIFKFQTADNVQAWRVGSNTSIAGLSLRANCGIINGDGTSNVLIYNCDMTWGYAGKYYNRFAFRGYGLGKNVGIDHCVLRDALSSDRNIDVGGGEDVYFTNCVWQRVNDGGHSQSVAQRFRVANNWVRWLHRMGFEHQDNDQDPKTNGNGTFENNQLFQPERPQNDTFGVSWICQFYVNENVRNNLFVACFDGNWGVPGGNEARRLGIGIEYGGNNNDNNNPDWIAGKRGGVFGNTIVGSANPYTNFVTGSSCAANGTPHKDNHIFGAQPAWGQWTGEGSWWGGGSTRDLGGNTYDPKIENGPKLKTMVQMGVGIKYDGPPATQPLPPPPGDVIISAKMYGGYDKVNFIVNFKNGEATKLQIERYLSSGSPDTTIPGPLVVEAVDAKAFSDTRFAANQIKDTWVFKYVAVAPSGERKQVLKEDGQDWVQIGFPKPPPTTQPIPPTTQPVPVEFPSYDLVTKIRKGYPTSTTTRPASD